MILHTVNKSSFISQCLEDCLRRVSANDGVILIEDGVFGSQSTSSASLISLQQSIAKSLDSAVCFYVLRPDFEARGLQPLPPDSPFELIDDDGFVELVLAADKVLSWY